MATTHIPPFEGTPTLTDEKVEQFKQWYAEVWGDYDKAGDVEDATYYAGVIDAYFAVLTTLYREDNA